MISKYESFLSRFFTKLNPIQKLCKKYKIENYTINSDGSIDVNGNVRINGCNLNEIPLKFKKVSGKFDCSNNNLISLEGCPQEVGEHFNCERNNLTSLEGGQVNIIRWRTHKG